ncbi:MAG: hypothetical protein M1365_17415 [Actinobacteria bacterium]|nr:hypothetical protein [Actinomycetota bacterium]
MTERNIGDGQQVPSSQQQNQELAGFLRFIPANVLEGLGSSFNGVELTPEGIRATNWSQVFENFFQEISTNMQRRASSELLATARQEFRELLGLSYLTPTAADYATEVYSREMIIGFATPKHALTGDLYWLLDLDNPSLGGIFNPDRVVHLERRLYFQALDQYSRWKMVQGGRESLGLTPEGKPYIDQETIMAGRKNIEQKGEELDKWRQEYEARYQSLRDN